MRPLLPWRTLDQHRSAIERAVLNGTLSRGHWYGDDNSLRRGRTGDMVEMLETLARVAAVERVAFVESAVPPRPPAVIAEHGQSKPIYRRPAKFSVVRICHCLMRLLGGPAVLEYRRIAS
jgi:hypothetical protein